MSSTLVVIRRRFRLMGASPEIGKIDFCRQPRIYLSLIIAPDNFISPISLSIRKSLAHNAGATHFGLITPRHGTDLATKL